MQPTIQVLATSEEGTRAALAGARSLSGRLNNAPVVLLVPRIVTYLTPPEGPREIAVITEQYRELVASVGVDATVRVCVCQRPADMFKWMIGRGALIVIGGRRRWWWHTAEQDLATELRRTGHQVSFADVAAATESTMMARL